MFEEFIKAIIIIVCMLLGLATLLAPAVIAGLSDKEKEEIGIHNPCVDDE